MKTQLARWAGRGLLDAWEAPEFFQETKSRWELRSNLLVKVKVFAFFFLSYD